MNGDARWRPGIVPRRALALLLGGALLLAGCSSLRLVYGQAETIVWWWLDGYVDFDRDQKPQAKAAVARWLAWHRQTQLPQYRQWLQQTELLLRGEPSGEQLCARLETAEPLRAQALAPLAQPVADIARRLRPTQREHLERRFAEKNAEWADKHLQRNLQERWEAATERSIDYTERLYGRLGREQKRWLAQRVQRSPWRAENDLSERQLRQRDTLATLQALAAPGLPHDEARAIATAWLARLAAPVDRPHAEAREAARRYLCDTAAEFHRQQASAEQRRHLASVLQGWEGDIEHFLHPRQEQAAF